MVVKNLLLSIASFIHFSSFYKSWWTIAFNQNIVLMPILQLMKKVRLNIHTHSLAYSKVLYKPLKLWITVGVNFHQLTTYELLMLVESVVVFVYACDVVHEYSSCEVAERLASRLKLEALQPALQYPEQ